MQLYTKEALLAGSTVLTAIEKGLNSRSDVT